MYSRCSVVTSGVVVGRNAVVDIVLDDVMPSVDNVGDSVVVEISSTQTLMLIFLTTEFVCLVKNLMIISVT